MKDVWKYIYKNLGLKYHIYLIRQYVKERLKLSFKIGKYRPSLLEQDKNMFI